MMFWIIATVMVIVALIMVVPVLWRKKQPLVEMDRNNQNVAIARERLAELEQEQSKGNFDEAEFETAKQELEMILLDDLQTPPTESATAGEQKFGRHAAIATALLVPMLTAALYWQLGAPQFIDMPKAVAAEAGPHGSQDSAELPSVDEMVARLAERLEKEPDDAEGWFTLGRTYMSMQRYQESAAALEKVHALVGDHPTIMLSLADALAMSNAGLMRGRPAELVHKSLAMAPENPTALWLAGMAAEEEGQYNQAIDYWRQLEPLLFDKPQSLLEVRQLIASAEKQLNGSATAASAATPTEATPGSAIALQVEVKLDAALADKVADDDTIFIYAKAEAGPPMPLAAVRKKASDLPLRITLDDTMAMTPQMKLSSFDKVIVGARISRSGNAMKQSGDLIGELSGVSVERTEAVTVIINQITP